jgi:hypothetical protein
MARNHQNQQTTRKKKGADCFLVFDPHFETKNPSNILFF